MILIIQNGFIVPVISRYLRYPYDIIKSYEKNVTEIELKNYSLVIILGGHQSANDIILYPYLLNVTVLIQKCILQKKPLLGICLGGQLIAKTLGCEIKSCGKMNVGYDAKILGYDKIFRSHFDYIVPNKNITVLEYFDNMPYLYKHSDYIYGIQCHPDLTPECVQKYCNHGISSIYAANNKDIIDKYNGEIMDCLMKYLLIK